VTCEWGYFVGDVVSQGLVTKKQESYKLNRLTV